MLVKLLISSHITLYSYIHTFSGCYVLYCLLLKDVKYSVTNNNKDIDKFAEKIYSKLYSDKD